MRVLVTWGSKLGGAESIGRIIAQRLKVQGFQVVAEPVRDVRTLRGFDAVIVGGALYANRWHPDARRFVRSNTDALRRVPVWFFSSGPLDDSADHAELPAPVQVAALAERVGARGHVTFGGRLEPTVKGFPAEAMARTHSGDWRNPSRIRTWTDALVAELPGARPGAAIDHPAQAPGVRIGLGAAAWAACAALSHSIGAFFGPSAAAVTHGIAAPLIFTALAWGYFRARGAHEPLPTAAGWAALVFFLDAALALGLDQDAGLFTRPLAIGLPLALVFLLSWGTGALVSTLPWPKLPRDKRPPLVAHPR